MRLHLVLALAVVVVASAGCDAIYTSDRPAQSGQDTTVPPPDSGPGDDSKPSPDMSGADGVAADAPPASGGPIADGNWEGRTGHLGKGSVELFRTASGGIELRFGADFATSPVPGPVVVLSSRDTLGSAINAGAGDLDLGALTAASGAQTYKVPGGDGGRRYVWVFCEPFGIEISRATLKDVN